MNLKSQNELFKNTINKSGKNNPRAEFINIARKMFEKDKKTEAALLLLSTWNYNNFKKTLPEFNYEKFEFVIKCLEVDLKEFSNVNFEKMDLTMERTKIINIFNRVCDISIVNPDSEYGCIGPTGAAKILYLYRPNQFIMWDSHIRGEDSKEKYLKLDNIDFYKPIFINENYPKFESDGYGYFSFLYEMQKLFHSSKYEKIARESNKSMAKAIDEFNFINISLKIK
jgi:hypothetical protein